MQSENSTSKESQMQIQHFKKLELINFTFTKNPN